MSNTSQFANAQVWSLVAICGAAPASRPGLTSGGVGRLAGRALLMVRMRVGGCGVRYAADGVLPLRPRRSCLCHAVRYTPGSQVGIHAGVEVCLPQQHLVVRTPGGKVGAAGSKGDRGRLSLMAMQRVEQVPLPQVEDLATSDNRISVSRGIILVQRT